MAFHTRFLRLLDELWDRRTAELRALVRPRPGITKKFNRQVRDRLVRNLLDVASTILVREVAQQEFDAVFSGRKRRGIRKRGLAARGEDLVAFSDRFSGPIIYSFWRRDRCLYVGKGKTARRLAGYEKSAYLLSADTVLVHEIPTKSKLPKAECLATHLYEPRDNRVKPARVRWGKRCPVCRQHDQIKRRLSALFPMR
jgi:hypothetical protein